MKAGRIEFQSICRCGCRPDPKEIVPIPPDASSNERFVQLQKFREEIDEMCGIPERFLHNHEEVKKAQK